LSQCAHIVYINPGLKESIIRLEWLKSCSQVAVRQVQRRIDQTTKIMKPTKILMCAMAVGAMTFAASKASAFPLTLKSLSGTITSTAIAGTSTTATKSSVNLKKLMLVVSNEVVLNGGPTPPANATIVVDPYQYDSVNVSFQVYLTNSSGYFYSLSSNNVAFFNIYDIATTFKSNGNGGSENDTICVELDIFGTGPDGLYCEFDVFGSAKLSASTNGKTGIDKMTVSLKNGGGLGVYQDSDDGVSSGGFNLQGPGIPPVAGPYSTWWYDNNGYGD
jgi:hypothetical protein